MKIRYGKTPLKSVITVKALYSVHYFKYRQRFSFGESHDFWELVYIDSGEAELSADGRPFTLSQGEAYFHKPNEHHTIATKNRFANSVIISFDCSSSALKAFEGLKTVLTDEEKSILRRIVTEGGECFSDKLNEVYLPRLHRADAPPFGGEQLIRLYIEQLLILIYRRTALPVTSAKPEQAADGTGLSERIKAYLRSNLSAPVTLDELSQALFFSKTYLKAVFKRETGSTIMQYFTALKIDEAKRLVSEDRYTFTEISDMLGYSSLQYLSRQFKAVTTMTLSEYARSIKLDGVL